MTKIPKGMIFHISNLILDEISGKLSKKKKSKYCEGLAVAEI